MQTILDKFFPLWRLRNVALFYVLSSIYNMWIVAAVWVFIWGRFMTKFEIGISDMITFAVGFLVELPSGVFADMIGRRKAIIIGNTLMTVGNFLLALSSSFAGITVWYLVWTVGYAFQSGATEALVYDTLRQNGHEKEWHKVAAAATVVGRTTSLIAYALGGFLFTFWFRLPYLSVAATGLIGIAAALCLREVAVKKPATWSLQSYIGQMKDGLSTLVKPQVRSFALLCLAVSGIAYMYNWGLLRPLTAERFGFSPQAYAYLLTATTISGLLAVSFVPYIKKLFKTEQLLLAIGALFMVNFFSMGFSHGWLIGGAMMCLVSVLLLYNDIFFSQFINLHTREEHRATTLSAVALFTRLPYVLLAVAIGIFADRGLLAEYTLVVGAIGICLWLLSYGGWRKTD